MSKTFFAIALLVAGAVSGCGCHNSQASVAQGAEPPPGEVWLTPAQVAEAKIAVEEIAPQDVDDTILTSGKVTFEDIKVGHVYSPVSGRVVSIEGQLGARVAKGDGLAVIQSPDIGVASSDVGKAEADLIAAEHDLKRKKDLFAQHAASAVDVESAEDSYRKAKAEKDRAAQKAFLLRAGGSGDSVTQGYRLVSPIDGEVLMRNLSMGVEVQGQYGGGQAQELFTVGELDRVWVLADLYEIDLARVHVGQHATVRVVAYPNKVFDGQVDWVSGMLDPVTRTAKVRCSFDNPDRLLKPEMYATIAISVDVRKALAIPKGSVIRLGDQTVVFVERGKTPDGKIRFERLPVAVDEGEGSHWLPVSHGLEAGMRIVTGGTVLLSGML